MHYTNLLIYYSIQTTAPSGASYIALSKDGSLLAAATDQKQLIVWDTTTNNIILRETLVKRPMAIDIASISKSIIVAGNLINSKLLMIFLNNALLFR